MIPRALTIQNNYSFFLFGPRGSGKSTFLRQHFAHISHVWIDLLDPDEEALFQDDPHELTRRIAALPAHSWIVIDEVQKAPKLLNLVHKYIEEKKLLFALSGSSARKLKRGAANLLAGRAFVYHLFPFSSQELGQKIQLQDVLEWGSLPKILQLEAKAKKLFLQTYATTYLKEEIQAEQIVRNLPNFRKFLEVAAQMNGKPLNYSKLAKDIHTDHSVMRTYYEILEDTLVGFRLPSYDESIRQQQRKAAKFYFIDCGITRALNKTLDVPLLPKTYEYGRAFEHFIILEFFKLCEYRKRDETLSYLQTKDDVEVDLIIKRPGKTQLFLEIKSTSQLSGEDFTSLEEITDGLKNVDAFVLSCDPHPKAVKHVKSVHWQEFLRMFQNDEV